MLELLGRWAFVSGASRGVGKQIALGLSKLGCNLILHSRKIEHTCDLEVELLNQGIKVIRVEANLENREEIDNMLKVIDTTGVNVEIVYNVAAVNASVLDFFNTPLSYYDIIFKVNVFAVAQITQHFVPKMIKNGFGRIVNVSSTINTQPSAWVYSASKSALDKMTKEMAYAVHGSDIIISIYAPPWVKTDMGSVNAKYPVECVYPGGLLGAVVNDQISGRIFVGENYIGMSLSEAYNLEKKSPLSIYPDYLTENLSRVDKAINLKDFLEKTKSFRTTQRKKILFGGGNQVKFVLDIFDNVGCKIDAILCTQTHGQKDIKGVPLYTVNDLPYESFECAVMVAISENQISAIQTELMNSGFEVMPSYSILYTRDAWLTDDETLVSNIYEYTTNTFTGNGIGN